MQLSYSAGDLLLGVPRRTQLALDALECVTRIRIFARFLYHAGTQRLWSFKAFVCHREHLLLPTMTLGRFLVLREVRLKRS